MAIIKRVANKILKKTGGFTEDTSLPNITTTTGVSVNQFTLPQNGDNIIYIKIAELVTTPPVGESSSIILYISGVSDSSNNVPGIDTLQASTSNGVKVEIYNLVPSGTEDITYGYVINDVSGKTEIWIKRDPNNYPVCFTILQVSNAEYGILETQYTEPSGIIYVTKEYNIFTSTDGGMVPNADKLDGYDGDYYRCNNGCSWTCSSSCTGTCSGGCSTDCTGTCTATCASDCTAGCTGGCSNTCTGSCSGNCTGSCTGTCVGACTGCTGTCTGNCTGTCTGRCTDSCTSCDGR